MSKEKKRGVRPKKALGQHFLHDQHTARRIVDSLVRPGDAVLRLLEIGPGMVATVSLLGDKRSVLGYIFSPITKLGQRAFIED